MYREQYGEYAHWYKGVEVFRKCSPQNLLSSLILYVRPNTIAFFFIKDMHWGIDFWWCFKKYCLSCETLIFFRNQLCWHMILRQQSCHLSFLIPAQTPSWWCLTWLMARYLTKFNWTAFQMGNRPFYSCVLSCQAFDLEWGWRWPVSS